MKQCLIFLLSLGIVWFAAAQSSGQEAASAKEATPQAQSRMHREQNIRPVAPTFAEYIETVTKKLSDRKKMKQADHKLFGWLSIGAGVLMLGALGGMVAFYVRARNATEGFGAIAEFLGALFMAVFALIFLTVGLVLYFQWKKRRKNSTSP